MKKLIPALCMLLVAATLLGTSTYAWFSMNRNVTANGMQIKATTSSDLYIFNGELDGAKWKAAPDLATMATEKLSALTDIAKYSNETATMTPSSTSDFTNFYYIAKADEITVGGSAYTTNPKADMVNTVAVNYENLETAKNYVQAARCYLAVNEVEAKAYTSFNCTVTITATDSGKDDMLNTVRVAVLITGTSGTAATKVWSADGDTATKPLSGVTTLSATAQSTVASGTSATVFNAPKSNEVYTVNVLVWVEGQDSECLNNNALNSAGYKVDLAFELVG